MEGRGKMKRNWNKLGRPESAKGRRLRKVGKEKNREMRGRQIEEKWKGRAETEARKRGRKEGDEGRK